MVSEPKSVLLNGTPRCGMATHTFNYSTEEAELGGGGGGGGLKKLLFTQCWGLCLGGGGGGVGVAL